MPPIPDAIRFHTPEETRAAAARIAPLLTAPAPTPLRIYLSGELGAGKTFFIRALLAALGENRRVPSPSYALVYSYTIGTLTVHHLDCYRLQGAFIGDDLLELLDDADSLCLVEWHEQAQGLPAADLELHFSICGECARTVHCRAASTAGQALATQLVTGCTQQTA